MIPLFLEDNLDNQEMQEFLIHVNSCEDCREELTIQFLISVGLKRLEDGNTFNLAGELEQKLRDAGHKMKVRSSLQWSALVLQVLVVIALIILIAVFLLLR
jgi:hypothetical protein